MKKKDPIHPSSFILHPFFKEFLMTTIADKQPTETLRTLPGDEWLRDHVAVCRSL